MQTIKLSDLNIYDIGNTIQIAGALFAGDGKVYLVPLPIVADELNGEMITLQMDEAEWNTFLRQTDLMEVQNSAKAILRKSNRMIDTSVQWQVWRRDKFTCVYCGKDSVPLTVDHILVWEDGGPSTEENMVTACRKCNKLRGNMEYREWLHSEKYANVSKKLPLERTLANIELCETLPSIKRVDVIRSR